MRRPWTSSEHEALRILGPMLGGRGCADAFERSLRSVQHRAAQLGVSLRRKSLGGVSGAACSPAGLRRVRELALAGVCPACGLRPIGVRRTGLCGRCHFDGLRLVHQEAIALADGQLALYASRSMLYRRRRSLAELTHAETGDGRETIGAESIDPKETTCQR